MQSQLRLLLLVTLVSATAAITIPAGCTYDYQTGIFTCDYRSCLPLNGSEFMPPPQKLVIDHVYGTFLPTDFTDFDTVNLTAFDMNYDASLTLECHWGIGPSSLLTLNETSFGGMNWYQNLLIKNCEIEYLIPNAFSFFETLNFLGFEGGYINYVSSMAMHGLNLEPDTTAVQPLGELSFVDVDMIVGGFPIGLMDPLENMTILTVIHSRFIVLLDDAWKNLHKVHTLTLDNNPFTYLPQAAFRNMTSLNMVSAENINWQCGCGNMWFVDYFATNGIAMRSEANCASPIQHAGQRASNFWEQMCAEKFCDLGAIPAVDFGVVCLTYLQIAIYTMGTFAFFQTMVVLVICFKVRKKALNSSTKEGLRTMTPRRPPPRQSAPVSHHNPKMAMYGGNTSGSYA